MVRVISIANEVYKELSRIKGEQSFSQVIMSLLKKEPRSNRNEVLALFGRKDLIDVKKIKELEKDWKKWSKKMFRCEFCNRINQGQ